MSKKLPNKLSSLLELAINDAQALARSKRFVLDMGRWLVALPDDKCAVCLAGAVMSRTLETARPATGFEIGPYGGSYGKNKNKLLAINAMRTGDFFAAARELDIEYTDDQADAIQAARDVVKAEQEKHPLNGGTSPHPGRAPWRAYRRAIKVLRGAGL